MVVGEASRLAVHNLDHQLHGSVLRRDGEGWLFH